MSLLDGIEHLRNGLDYHLARHNVLTANLSQIDTPGFRPLDLERHDRTAFASELTLQLAATDPRHVGSEASAPGTWDVVRDGGSTPGADGNAVSVDREAVKIASNHLRYETISTLVSTQLASLAWAATDGRTG